VNIPLDLKWAFFGPRFCLDLSIKTAARIISIVLCLGGSYAYAACEQEAAALCSGGNPHCLEDAARSVEQATNDCKTPEGRQQYASLWQATPSFFDNAPHEHVFWRCVARQCDAPQDSGK
jgi:hypothetical protein